MRQIRLNCFPGGKTKALTMSYDDGKRTDQDLIAIFNRYGIKGTFHLNSARLTGEAFIPPVQVREVYAGHEIACHTATHPWLGDLPDVLAAREILADKEALEALAGYPVRGLSYPYGSYSKGILKLLPGMGIDYARTTVSHGGFHLPGSWLEWPATCHHKDNLLALGEQFLEPAGHGGTKLMYVWGHSSEFAADGNWELMERFCSLMGSRSDIWFATNIAIMDYMEALGRLRWTVSGEILYNPSAIPVWVSVDGTPVRIEGGATLHL